MRFDKLSVLLVFCGLCCNFMNPANSAARDEKQTLGIGDPAPQLQVIAWLKGTPVAEFQKGKVYVVEFWATWCEPCREQMPHMSELARKYTQAHFIGVSSELSKKTTVAYVRKFVNKQDAQMAFNIAMDDPGLSTTYKAWVSAAGLGAIPQVFIVDGAGKIAWIGAPDSLEQPLSQVLNGTLDPQAARAVLAAEREIQVQSDHEVRLSTALERKEYPAALTDVERIISDNPVQERWAYRYKLMALLYIDESRGLAYAHTKLADAAFIRAYNEQMKSPGDKDDPDGGRAAIGAAIGTTEGLSQEVYRFAADCLQQALKKRPDALDLWTALAQTRYYMHDSNGAVEAQEMAIAIATRNVDRFGTGVVERMKAMLAAFQKKNG